MQPQLATSPAVLHHGVVGNLNCQGCWAVHNLQLVVAKLCVCLFVLFNSMWQSLNAHNAHAHGSTLLERVGLRYAAAGWVACYVYQCFPSHVSCTVAYLTCCAVGISEGTVNTVSRQVNPSPKWREQLQTGLPGHWDVASGSRRLPHHP
jgi:hypothetical protein